MSRRAWPLWAVLLVLFVAYQLPEGLGIHVLGRPALQGGLLLLFFPVAWLLARARGYGGFGAYAMALHPGWAWNMGLMLGVAFLAKLAAVAAGVMLGVYAFESSASLSGSTVLAVAGIVFVTFWPSVAEDLLTRGFWFRQVPGLGRGLGFVLFTSAFYVLNHVYRLQNGPIEWAMLFAFGLAYATAVVRTGSLWAAIGLHWGWNIAAFSSASVFGLTTLRTDVSPLLSAAAHLLALGAVLLLTPVLRRDERAPTGPPAPTEGAGLSAPPLMKDPTP